MDQATQRDETSEVDLESGRKNSEEYSSIRDASWVKGQTRTISEKVCGVVVDGSILGEQGTTCCNISSLNGVPSDNVKVVISKSLDREECADHLENSPLNEKPKKKNNKKPPRPPRPPRGLSLDAADQKLIKELAELAMLKRARIERMKAMKKMRASKIPPSNSNVVAMVFTAIFCLLVIFQGMSSRNSPMISRGPSVSTTTAADDFISVQGFPSPSSTISPHGLDSGPSSLAMKDAISKGKFRRVAG